MYQVLIQKQQLNQEVASLVLSKVRILIAQKDILGIPNLYLQRSQKQFVLAEKITTSAIKTIHH